MCNTAYTFKDIIIGQYVRRLLKKNIIHDVTIPELASIDTLVINNKIIDTLEDLPMLANLKHLNLSNCMFLGDLRLHNDLHSRMQICLIFFSVVLAM